MPRKKKLPAALPCENDPLPNAACTTPAELADQPIFFHRPAAKRTSTHKPKKTRTVRQRWARALCFCGAALLAWFVLFNTVPKLYRFIKMNAALLFDQQTEDYVPLQIWNGEENYARYSYPTDLFFTTAEREAYNDGDMQLQIPALGLETDIYDGVSAATLKQGPGLYDCSTLPSYGNPNVCIAAHRGVYGAEFFLLDQLKAGDVLYLDYDGYRFTYDYVETVTTDESDWSLMYCTDYSALTLSTCLMDSTSERLIVRAKLVSIVAQPAAESAQG